MLSALKCNDPFPKAKPALSPQKAVVSRIRAQQEEGLDVEYFESEEDAACNLGINIVWIKECVAGQRNCVLSKFTGKRFNFCKIYYSEFGTFDCGKAEK